MTIHSNLLDRWQEASDWYSKAVEKLKPWFISLSKERQGEVMELSEGAGKEMDKVMDDYVKEKVDLEAMKEAIRRWYKAVKGC